MLTLRFMFMDMKRTPVTRCQAVRASETRPLTVHPACVVVVDVMMMRAMSMISRAARAMLMGVLVPL